MRTLIIIIGGIVLWMIYVGAVRIFMKRSKSSTSSAVLSFICIWFFVAAANMWIGVATAGYTVFEELPIFLLIFIIPSAIAIYTRKKLI